MQTKIVIFLHKLINVLNNPIVWLKNETNET